MTNDLIVAFIGVAGVLVGSLVTALTAWLSFRRARKVAALHNSLVQALRDCRAFYALEQAYCVEIASHGPTTTAESVRRRVRGHIRATGMATPSEGSSPVRLEQSLARLLRESSKES